MVSGWLAQIAGEILKLEKDRDDYYFRCVSCAHDMFEHFHLEGSCNEIGCQCAKFQSKAMAEHGR